MPLRLRKAYKPWIVEYVFNVLNEIGYSGGDCGIAERRDPERRESKMLAAAKRSCPTGPLEVPAR